MSETSQNQRSTAGSQVQSQSQTSLEHPPDEPGSDQSGRDRARVRPVPGQEGTLEPDVKEIVLGLRGLDASA
jgi:hypothetical protein